MSVPASACTAAESETYGGQTTTSASPRSSSRSAQQNAVASRGPLNIFQLPAISTGSGRRDRRHAGQLLALEQFERRAAARGDPRDPVGDAGLVDRAHR